MLTLVRGGAGVGAPTLLLSTPGGEVGKVTMVRIRAQRLEKAIGREDDDGGHRERCVLHRSLPLGLPLPLGWELPPLHM